MITAKSTKAEILAAHQALEARLKAQYVTLPLARNTARRIADEAVALIRDTFNAGAACRRGVAELVAVYSQPILKVK
jgi:hypothetical protein